MKALSPNSKGSNELTDIIGKIMIFSELVAVKQTVKKCTDNGCKMKSLSFSCSNARINK